MNSPRKRRPRAWLWVALIAVSLLPCIEARSDRVEGQAPRAVRISKGSSDSCAKKVRELEERAAATSRRSAKIRFSEDEINSYLAMELKSRFHPSLRSLTLAFTENKLEGIASIDFDNLGMNSTKFLGRLLAKMFSGVHELTMSGMLETVGGKGRFVLEEARFDSNTLPNFLVEEIISAVGRKQKPPFDPLQPSQLPYNIDRVELHRGYIIVCQ